MATMRQFRQYRRRGSATLWLVIWLPCLMALFCVLVGVANLWLARVELENAMEAAALAAAKSWGDANGGNTLTPRTVGVGYAQANSVRRDPVVIGTNYDSGGGPNENAECDAGLAPPTGNLIFGSVDRSNPNHVIFDAGTAPGGQGGGNFGVRAQAIIEVQPLGFQPFLGNPPPYRIQAKATAEYDIQSQSVRLIRVNSVVCP